MSLLSPNYHLQEVTRQDIVIASLAWGFTMGFGWLSVCTAAKQTFQAHVRTGRHLLHNTYVWMIWSEVIVCLVFGIICFLHLNAIITPCFAFYFSILTLWALQVQFLLQIIINRCSLLITDPVFAWRLKVGVAVLITAVNISVYNIWIPARLQISDRYIHINEWWDRTEKCIYLIVDGCLNFYFIFIVKRSLVQNGLYKYNRLVHYNMAIVGLSLSMDVLIIGMMSLNNTFVYMQFHPLAYMVKLNIEMSMADLIGSIAKEQMVLNGYAYRNSCPNPVPSGTGGNRSSGGGGGGGGGGSGSCCPPPGTGGGSSSRGIINNTNHTNNSAGGRPHDGVAFGLGSTSSAYATQDRPGPGEVAAAAAAAYELEEGMRNECGVGGIGGYAGSAGMTSRCSTAGTGTDREDHHSRHSHRGGQHCFSDGGAGGGIYTTREVNVEFEDVDLGDEQRIGYWGREMMGGGGVPSTQGSGRGGGRVPSTQGSGCGGGGIASARGSSRIGGGGTGDDDSSFERDSTFRPYVGREQHILRFEDKDFG